MIVKAHIFAVLKSDIGIIRNVAVEETSEKILRGMINSRMLFNLSGREIIMAENSC